MLITQFIHDAHRTQPNAVALICNDRQTTYAQLKHKVAQVAGGLKKLGLHRDHPVGILALNSDRYIECMLGTFWAGGVITPINTRWAIHEIAYVLNECAVEILCLDEHFQSYITPLQQQCPSLKSFIFIGEAQSPEACIDYSDWVNNSVAVEDARCGGDDLAAVFYTGGTTGKPKGVMLSHDNIVTNADISSSYLNSTSGISLQVPPLFHIGGMSWMMQVILRHMTLVVLKNFIAVDVFKAIEKYKIKEGFFVPTMLQMLVNQPTVSEYDLSSLEIIIYGASAINPSLLKQAFQTFDGVGFVQFYGMTELSPIVTVLTQENHRDESKLKAGGYPIRGCEVNIIDPDGQILAANQVGEVVVKGSNVMLGYWKNPQETAKVLKNGWLYTGDGGYLTEDDFLSITDRLKDMIITGGENVYSTEVENALLSHPSLHMCAVIGVPHEIWGEAVHAVLVTHPGIALDQTEIADYCRQHLSSFKCPRSFEFRTDLPLSGVGKILKNVLRDEYQQQHHV